MRYRKIGDTRIPVIGQGTGGINNENLIKLGLTQGLTLIDTAESYGNEEVIGKAIKGHRDDVFISTKFSPEHNGDVVCSCEGSLKRLGTDYIDLYMMYYPNPKIPIGETLLSLTKLVDSGKIRFYGVCNTCKLDDYHGISAVQNEYNLFDRSCERILPYCKENNIIFMAYSPLLDYHELNPEKMVWLHDIAMKYQRPIGQIILNFLVAHNPVVVIPRASNPAHILHNAHASDFTMSNDDIEAIDELFTPDIVYLDVKKIDITLSADKFPQTKEQAMTYEKWIVKPQDLDLDDFKPVKVRMAAYGDYELIEGGLRYWAWVIQKTEPIPCIIKDRWILDSKLTVKPYVRDAI